MNFRFECPQTGSRFSPHLRVNGRLVALYWDKDIRLRCPCCGNIHGYNFKKHYIDAALAAGEIDEVPTSTL
jgi:hypothetical protein